MSAYEKAGIFRENSGIDTLVESSSQARNSVDPWHLAAQANRAADSHQIFRRARRDISAKADDGHPLVVHRTPKGGVLGAVGEQYATRFEWRDDDVNSGARGVVVYVLARSDVCAFTSAVETCAET